MRSKQRPSVRRDQSPLDDQRTVIETATRLGMPCDRDEARDILARCRALDPAATADEVAHFVGLEVTKWKAFEAAWDKLEIDNQLALNRELQQADCDARCLADNAALLRAKLNENSTMLGHPGQVERGAYRRLEKAYSTLYEAAQDVLDALSLVESLAHGPGSYLETAIWALREHRITDSPRLDDSHEAKLRSRITDPSVDKQQAIERR